MDDVLLLIDEYWFIADQPGIFMISKSHTRIDESWLYTNNCIDLLVMIDQPKSIINQ